MSQPEASDSRFAETSERVTFSRGYGVCIMGIDGTWRRDCLLKAISDIDAILTVEGSISGPQSQGVLSVAVLHRPGLSPMRAHPRQRHRDRCRVSEVQEQEKAVGRLAQRGLPDRSVSAFHRLDPAGQSPALGACLAGTACAMTL